MQDTVKTIYADFEKQRKITAAKQADEQDLEELQIVEQNIKNRQ